MVAINCKDAKDIHLELRRTLITCGNENCPHYSPKATIRWIEEDGEEYHICTNKDLYRQLN